MPGNLLIVVVDEHHEPELRHEVQSRPEPVEGVHVVAPAQLDVLHWLATDEDEARDEAAGRALAAEWSLADDADVAGEPGEADPVLAVEDALHGFPADEILVVADPERDDGLEASLRKYGLPVTRVPPAAHTLTPHPVREFGRSLVGGRSRATPFVAFVSANLFLFLLAVVISAIAVIVFLLAR